MDLGSREVPSSRVGMDLLFLAEVIGIDPLDGVGGDVGHADPVVEHQIG